VLEVNDSPSFNINLCKEGQTGLLKWSSEVDRKIKTTVIGDAIKLMYKHKERGELERYKCWGRILPGSESSFDILMNAKAVFDHLGNKQKMSSNNFCKLANCLKGLDKTTMSLLFVKITKAHNTSQMDFKTFLFACQELQQKLQN